jgi:predicted TPR repeat methyltransferase
VPELPIRFQWTLQCLRLRRGGRVVEFGYGGGEVIAALQSRADQSAIDGIDRSATAVARAHRRNSDAIEHGKSQLLHGDFLRDAPQSRYDQAFAVNVNVFWRDPEAAFAAASAWVKRKGSLLLVFEAPGAAKATAIADALQRADASPFALRRCRWHPDNKRLVAFRFTH